MLTSLFFLDEKKKNTIKRQLSTVESLKLLSPSVYLSSLTFQNFLKYCKPDGYHIAPHEFNSSPNFKDTFATNSVFIQIRFLDLTKEKLSSVAKPARYVYNSARLKGKYLM